MAIRKWRKAAALSNLKFQTTFIPSNMPVTSYNLKKKFTTEVCISIPQIHYVVYITNCHNDNKNFFKTQFYSFIEFNTASFKKPTKRCSQPNHGKKD